MSSKRASGSGPALDHEPSFDSEFDVSDEALNARPDARARPSRAGPKPAGGKSSGGIVIAGVGLAAIAAGGFVAYKLLGAPDVPPPPPPEEAAVVAPAPAPEAAPTPPPKAEPTKADKPAPAAEAPVTKVAPTVIAAPAEDTPEDEAPAKASAKASKKRSRGKRNKAEDEPDLRLDSALEKLNAIEAPPAAEASAESEPAPSSPGAECEAGKAEACVTFGKSLVGKDFNAALTAFERGCALGANKGCLEGTRLAEKAGGGEKARELSSIACGRGSATGCRLLASLFQRGVGGAPDPDKAKTFYAKACEAGDTAACGQ